MGKSFQALSSELRKTTIFPLPASVSITAGFLDLIADWIVCMEIAPSLVILSDISGMKLPLTMTRLVALGSHEVEVIIFS